MQPLESGVGVVLKIGRVAAALTDGPLTSADLLTMGTPPSAKPKSLFVKPDIKNTVCIQPRFLDTFYPMWTWLRRCT